MRDTKAMQLITSMSTMAGGVTNLVSLDPDELLFTAKAITGLSDFGDEDWKKNYFTSLNQANNNPDLSLTWRMLQRIRTLTFLKSRLQTVEKIKQDPTITEKPISKPIFITGNPRTGTSILFELLAQDKNFRAPRLWEAWAPFSSAEIADSSRMNYGKHMDYFLSSRNQRMKKIHSAQWNSIAECDAISAVNFSNAFFFAENYDSWKKQMLPRNRYIWHKRFLQIHQDSPQERNWLLKCPSHLHFMDILTSMYPDARIIFTHRDPARSIPSYLSLYENLTQSKQFDPEKLIMPWREGCRNAIKTRLNLANKEQKIFDLEHHDFMKDPIAEIKKIYAFFDLKYSRELESRMLFFLQKRQSNKPSTHTYQAEDYGLSSDEIRKQFDFYIEHYKVKISR